MDDPRRKAQRRQVGLLVKLKHPTLASFAEAFATNVSAGGMFLRSRTPQPVGTRVKFEVQLADGQRAMKGIALVKWVRGDSDAGGPPGMGLEFELLDEMTRSIVNAMVRAREPAPELELDIEIPEDGAAPTDIQAPSEAPEGSIDLSLDTLLAETQAPDLGSPASDAALDASLDAALGVPAPADDGADFSGFFGVVPGELVGLPVDEVPLARASPAVAPPPVPRVAPAAAVLTQAGPPPPPAASPPRDDGVRATVSGLFGDLSFDDAAAPPEPALDLEASGPSPGAAVDLGDALGDLELDVAPSAEAPPPLAPPAARAPPAAPVEAAPRPPPPRAPAAPVTAQAPAPPARPPGTGPTRARPELPTVPPPRLGVGAAGVGPRIQVDLLAADAPLPERTGAIIGIDLGTTNSCVALVQGTRTLVVKSREGHTTIPSVVSLTPTGKLLVGHRAKGHMVLKPSLTIYGAKRLVGRPFDSPQVAQVKDRFQYDIVAGPDGNAAVRLEGEVLSLEQVQAIVLKECRQIAEESIGQPVCRAVITVPAYYSEPQREAVRRSARLAGLHVERILNEPTAAAMAFGMNRGLDKKVLVFDLGGGTFDATVMKVDDNVFEVLATGGDIFLGGIDFDNAIVDLLIKRFEGQLGLPFKGDAIAVSRVRDAAERAKLLLTETQSTVVDIPMLMIDDAGTPHSLRCTLTREDINAACAPLVERTFDVVQDVLLDAKVKAKELDDIIVVGGQSRMPLVREQIKKFFGKQASASVHADEAVAMGAALYCSTVDKVSSVVLIDVLPMTIGVGLPGGGFKRLVERNSPLPTTRSFTVATSRDDEKTLDLSLFQGEDANVAANEYLGDLRIQGLPRGPAGTVKVAVHLRLDAECVIHVEATELRTRKSVSTTLATRSTAADVLTRLGISTVNAKAAQAGRAAELAARGGSFWTTLKKAFGRK